MGRDRLRATDYSILVAISVVLFGFSLVGGRYLTMHEAVLPQSAREMSTAGEWVVPLSAGRPWLERPPLPQWLVIAAGRLAGRWDAEWVVRLPSACAAALVVLLVASTASHWFGRVIGLLSGLCLATMFEFTRYAWLAEHDIYLCAIVTLSIAVFARIEFGNPPPADALRFAGNRSLLVWLWFALLGMTNLAKGLLFGAAMAVIPAASFLLLGADISRIRRYVWLWGALLSLGIAMAWPIAAYLRYPDVVDLWKFDLVGRLTGEYTAINQPPWYYWANLPALAMPWSPLAAVAMALTARNALSLKFSPERFLWCWAIAPLVVFSLPGGKHHHYLLQCLAPWAVLSAIGVVRLRHWTLGWHGLLKTPLAGAGLVGFPAALAIAWFGPRLAGPAWIAPAAIVVVVVACAALAHFVHHRRDTVAAASVFSCIVAVYLVGFFYNARHRDECRNDSEFFRAAARRAEVDGRSLIVNADLDTLDVFRVLFYAGPRALPIHNLSFLRDARLRENRVLVLTRAGDFSNLERLGRARWIAQSNGTRRESSPADRFALFDLELHPDLVRFENSERISPMQAMSREPGPYLGDPILSYSVQKRIRATHLAN